MKKIPGFCGDGQKFFPLVDLAQASPSEYPPGNIL
jgi:hypothetical protein